MFKAIIQWVARLFGRQQADPHGREIFRYFDGQKERGADPLRTHRRFLDHPTFNLDLHPKLVDAGDKEAMRITLAAIAEILNVKPWDDATQTGLPEYEILELFIRFYAYIDSLKKNIEQPVTSPQPTDSPPLDPQSPGESTSDTLGSLGTSIDSPSAPAGSS